MGKACQQMLLQHLKKKRSMAANALAAPEEEKEYGLTTEQVLSSAKGQGLKLWRPLHFACMPLCLELCV
jgi:hypothetical protein